MPRTLPRKHLEAGRIRIGMRVPNKSGKGTHPEKLSTFRLTSKDQWMLQAAQLNPDIGGELREWQDAPGEAKQWELLTETDTLRVLIPTLQSFSVSYEQWRSDMCHFRCNGRDILFNADHPEQIGTLCSCTDDNPVCDRILRLNVQLPDLPSGGVWRLDTKGYNATAELVATCEQLANAGLAYSLIEGSLRLEQRTRKKLAIPEKGGKATPVTYHFAVPVLVPAYTPREMMAGSSRVMFLQEPPKQLPEHIADLVGEPIDVMAVDGRKAVAESVSLETQDEFQRVWDEVSSFMRKQGMTEEAIFSWYQSTKEKYAPFTKEKLWGIFEKMKQAASQKNIPKPDNDEWRGLLLSLAAQLPEDDLEYSLLRADAQRLCENPDATASQGEAMMQRIQSEYVAQAFSGSASEEDDIPY